MKTIKTISLLFLAVFIASCTATKKNTNESLYNNTWELDYLSGPRIAFSGLYPDRKPKITFNETTHIVAGTDSCNGYSAEFTVTDDTISFGEPGPSTMMYCGEGEKFFLNTIKKINKYTIDSEGKLNLMIDDVTMMRFKKITQE